MPMVTALDLFCGAAGGWSVALHEHGIETVAACEIDPWRRETFSKNFPRARMYDDVKTLTADRLLADLGYLPDIIVGSPPCQDASTANTKGRGVDGERTGLFFEAVRLVREVRPLWACYENVPGLKARGYDRVHTEMEAAGYTVRPLVVGAWHAGAPHRRSRVWIVAIAKSEQVGRAGQPRREVVGDVADAACIGRGQGRSGRFDPSDPRQPQQALHDADPALVQRPALARYQPNGFDAGAAPNTPTNRRGAGGEPCKAGAGRQSALHDEHDPNTGGTDTAGRGEAGGRIGWQGALAQWPHWNGGPPDLGRVDDGLPKGMARKMLSAYGDAVVPAVASAVVGAIMEVTR